MIVEAFLYISVFFKINEGLFPPLGKRTVDVERTQEMDTTEIIQLTELRNGSDNLNLFKPAMSA